MAKKKSTKKSTKKTTTKKTTTTSPKVTVAAPSAAPVYRSTAAAPAEYVAGVYKSEYGDRLNKALDTVTNWKYDPLQDASYKALASVYAAQGNIAAKNSMADAAALNGGYGTSHAVSAAQQARNEYNQQLAQLIPGLESAAYERATGTLSALRDADDTAYGRFRDTETDKQWKYSQEYQKYRDKVSDEQWQFSKEYDAYRDAMSDYQWGTNFNYQVDRDKVADEQWSKEYDLKKGSSGGGGGGGGGRSSGGSSYSSYSGSSGSTSPTRVNPNIEAAQTKGKSMTAYYKKQTKKNSGSPNR